MSATSLTIGKYVSRNYLHELLEAITPEGDSAPPKPIPAPFSEPSPEKTNLLNLYRSTPKLHKEITEFDLLKLIHRIESNPDIIEYLKSKGGGFLNREIALHINRSIYVGESGNIIINCKEHLCTATGFGAGSLKNVTASLSYTNSEILAFSSARLDLPPIRNPETGEMTLDIARLSAETEALAATLFRGLDNLVQYREVFSYTGSLKNPVEKQGVYMEFYNGGDILDLLNDLIEGDVKFDADQMCHFVYGICNGVANIHNLGYIHRDVKPDNIMCRITEVNGKKFYTAFTGDFGFISPEKDEKKLGLMPGSLAYYSPEGWDYSFYINNHQNHHLLPLVKDRFMKKLTCKMDVYAVGVILASLFLEIYPPDDGFEENGGDPVLQMLEEPVDKPIEHLVWRMTRRDYEERISMAEVLPQIEPAIREYYIRKGLSQPEGVVVT